MAKPDGLLLDLLPAFVSALQYSSTFSLIQSRQNGDQYFPHFPVGVDPIMNKLDGLFPGNKLYYSLDHNRGVTARSVKFLRQDDIAFLYLHTQEI